MVTAPGAVLRASNALSHFVLTRPQKAFTEQRSAEPRSVPGAMTDIKDTLMGEDALPSPELPFLKVRFSPFYR